VELLGGKPTPGIGFGIGIDRTVLAAAEQGAAPPAEDPLVAVVGADPEALAQRLEVASALRAAGLRVRADSSSRKLGKQLESGAKIGARFAVIVDPTLPTGSVILRDLSASEQRELPLGEVAAAIG
jgi:histidyl-tRNA synthetase